ncbi:MAG: single-stranded-DNA-specific exonuclease RecJ [Geminicoccaceae bacterium]|nr:single-stranded-DNA-specific exonuclease RecJ [Geminicoccaceae bacterium]
MRPSDRSAAIDEALLVERSFTGRGWKLAAPDDARALALCQRFDLPEIVGRILVQRQIDAASAEQFLRPRLRDCLPDPSHLLDLDAAVERIVAAVTAGDTIGIVGDYDVDGATSTALMVRYLRHFGCPTQVIIPDRLTDGYGPSLRIVERLAASGCRLVLTLDNGTTAHEPLARARELGIDVIVVDHHAPAATLPVATAIVNPNRADQTSPLRHLAAVGVVFVLAIALNRRLRARGDVPDLMRWLDLVALGTVCDVVPLTGLNRAFVHQGLKVAAAGVNPGMRALADLAGVGTLDDARPFGFAFGPRINAGGRLGHSGLGWKLLAGDDAGEAQAIAGTLDELNRRRQTLERQCLAAAQRAVEAQAEAGSPILVAIGDGWHPGVVGIVASRLVEVYGRPVLVISFDSDTGDGDAGKGSGRSVPGVDLGRLVLDARAAGLLEAGGGHPMAAGLSLTRAQLEPFRAFLTERSATSMPDGVPAAPLVVDALLAPSAMNLQLVEKLACLAPFGAGNGEPLLALKGARIMRPREVGQGHLSCLIGSPAGGAVKAIAFRAARRGLSEPLSLEGGTLMLAGRLRCDDYRGNRQPSFEIEDVAPA